MDKKENTPEKHSLIEWIKNIGPAGYLLFVFWGLLYETIYYSTFDVNIINYIDITEVLLVLYDDILFAILFAVIGMFAAGAIKMPLDIIALILSKVKKRYINPEKLFFPIVVIVGFIMLFISIPYDSNILNLFGTFFGAVWFSSIEYTFDKDFKTTKYAVVLIIFTTILLIPTSFRNAKLAIKEPKEIEVSFINKNIDHRTLGSILLGETRNYVFLYSIQDSTTTPVNRSQIEYLRFTKTDNQVIKLIKGNTVNKSDTLNIERR